MKLYDLKEEYLTLMEMMEDPDVDPQVIEDTLEGVEGELEAKADGYARMIRNLEGHVFAIDQELERLMRQKKFMQANAKRLKDSLQTTMIETGKRKFSTDLFSFQIMKNGGKLPVILDVKSTSELPDDLVRIKEEPNLEAIRELCEKGTCKYAHLGERTESLRIR